MLIQRTLGKTTQKAERRPTTASPGLFVRTTILFRFLPQVLCSLTNGGAELKEEKY